MSGHNGSLGLTPISANPHFNDFGLLNPNPPMDTDGRRKDTGRGVRKLQKRWSGLDSGRREVGGRSAGAFGGTDGGLQWLW